MLQLSARPRQPADDQSDGLIKLPVHYNRLRAERLAIPALACCALQPILVLFMPGHASRP